MRAHVLHEDNIINISQNKENSPTIFTRRSGCGVNKNKREGASIRMAIFRACDAHLHNVCTLIVMWILNSKATTNLLLLQLPSPSQKMSGSTSTPPPPSPILPSLPIPQEGGEGGAGGTDSMSLGTHSDPRFWLRTASGFDISELTATTFHGSPRTVPS